MSLHSGSPSRGTRTPRLVRNLLYAALFVLYLLHNDLWNWHDRSLVLGLPIGLFYHVVFCVVTSGVLTLLVVYAWPEHLDVPDANEGQGGTRPQGGGGH